MNYHWRAKVGIIFLVIISLFSTIRLLKELLSHFDLIGNDYVVLHEKKFKSLKNYLTPCSTIGYFNNFQTENEQFKNEKSKMEYVLTQYTLAPTIVVQSINYPLVVGHLDISALTKGQLSHQGLIVMKDFGNGIFLLNRYVPPRGVTPPNMKIEPGQR